MLVAWDWFQSDAILLAGADANQRLHLFDQMGSISVALLGIAFTVLAIITALPSTERTNELRRTGGWGLLEHTLMVTAAFALVTTVLAYVCSAVDNGPRGREPLEAALLGAACATCMGALIGGTAFALVLHSLRRSSGYRAPQGRGTGPA